VFLGTLTLMGFFQPREINRARLILQSLWQAKSAKGRAAARAAAEQGGAPRE
jgi:hypothetical protein